MNFTHLLNVGAMLGCFVLQNHFSILEIINQIKWSVYIDRQDGTAAEDDDMTALCS